MPAYNADIIVNTRLENQKSLNEAVTSIAKLTRDAKAIKPINIFAPGAGAKASEIGKQLEKIKKVARAINQGGVGPGKLSSTFAGAADQARVLSDVLANVNLNAKSSSASIDIISEAFARAELKAEGLRRNFEEVLNTARQAEATRTGDFAVALNPSVQAALSPSRVPEQIQRENEQINAALDERAELFEKNKKEVQKIEADFFSLPSLEKKVRDENNQINAALNERAELFEKNKKEIEKLEADFFSLEKQEQRAQRNPFGITNDDINRQLDERAKLISDSIEEAANEEINARQRVASLDKQLQQELQNITARDIEDETKRKIDSQNEAARRDLRERKRVNDEALRDFDRRLNERQTRRKQFREDLLLGAGFPLLFGGGPGAILGGVGGAVAGGGKGGFGAQIFFSALGAQFDALASKGLELARALDDPIKNLDTLIDALPSLDTGTESLVAELRLAGLEASAAAVVVEKFNRQLNNIGIDDVDKFTEDAKELQEAVKGLQLAAAALASSTLIGLINTLRDGFIILSNTKFQGATVQGAAAAAIAQGELTDSRTQTSTTGTSNQTGPTQDEIEKRFNQFKFEALQIERDRTALIAKAAEISTSQLNVERAKITLREAVLRSEQAITEQRLAQGTASEAAANQAADDAVSAEMVARQTLRRLEYLEKIKRIQAQRNVERAEISANNELFNLQVKEVELKRGKVAAIEKERQLLEQVVEGEVRSLNIQRQEVLEKNKGLDLDARINALFDRKILLAEEGGRLIGKELQIKSQLLKLEQEITRERELQNVRRGLEQEVRDTELTTVDALSPFASLERQQSSRREGIFGDLDLDEKEVQKKLQIKPDDEGLQKELAGIAERREAYEKLLPVIEANQKQQLLYNQTLNAVQGPVNSLVNGLTDVVTGTKTAEEAFADFLKSVADQLLKTAAVLIAQYIAIGIAKAFAGLGGGGGEGPNLDAIEQYSNIGANTPVTGVTGIAEGGYVSGPTRALVGEGGEPEYVIPSSKMRESMARYSRGARGGAVIPETGESGTSSEGGGTAVAAPIDVRFNVERINNVDYVTAEEFRAGMQRAAQKGAVEGERRALGSLRNSSAVRRRTGF